MAAKVDKSAIIENIAKLLLLEDEAGARKIIEEEYPHKVVEIEKRT